MMSRLSPSRKNLSCTLPHRIKSAVGLFLLEPSYTENPVHKVQIRRHLGAHHHNHKHCDDDNDLSGKEGERIFRLGLAADIGLAAGKAFTGYVSGSTAIIADAAHSLSDVNYSDLSGSGGWIQTPDASVLSGVALWSYKAGKTPKDKEHPYGHGKFETLGALGISGMLLATAGGIAWHGFDILVGLISSSPDMVNQSLIPDHMHGHNHGGHHHGMDMDHPILALNVTILSIAIKEGLYWITKRAGERQGSGLMKANAWHHRADAVSSVVALIGVGGSILGVKFLDPLAGLVVSGMIFKAGIETGYQSILELVDAAIPAEELQPIRKTILEVEGVKGCHRLRGRKAGSYVYLDVHIEVDPFSSVSAAHSIGESVRHHIHKSHSQVAEVFIHIDPSTSQFPSSVVDRQERLRGAVCQKKRNYVKDNDVNSVISNIIKTKFSQRMAVEHVTHHLLNGNMILEIEVSMPEDMLIRDAMELAKEAEKEILQAAPNCMQACIQLQLGHSIPEVEHKMQQSDKL